MSTFKSTRRFDAGCRFLGADGVSLDTGCVRA